MAAFFFQRLEPIKNSTDCAFYFFRSRISLFLDILKNGLGFHLKAFAFVTKRLVLTFQARDFFEFSHAFIACFFKYFSELGNLLRLTGFQPGVGYLTYSIGNGNTYRHLYRCQGNQRYQCLTDKRTA
ncbi:hypothetical protein SDC9_81717 [bioreactor metagenome]|uniref:Uncharacterized protein n=1 Tax=bioreactor metagenome TaxID=1076179 RepID=A0A644Z3F2_9ZZZZ